MNKKEYGKIEHIYRTLVQAQEPLSINKFMLPYVGEHIFGLSNISTRISAKHKQYLQTQYASPDPSLEIEVEIDDNFEIGEKEESSEMLRIDMKSLVSNVGSLFTGFIGRKR